MSHILGISGSLRKASFNSALLRAAQAMYPGRLTIARIDRIPLYNADEGARIVDGRKRAVVVRYDVASRPSEHDVESAAFPPEVEEVKQQVAEAQGVLLVSPEYNNSLPGVLKNAVDWLSRPSGDIRNVFLDKPIAVTGASPGGFGTVLGQSAWLPVLRTLRARHWTGGRLMVSHARDAFDDAGNLADEGIRKRLESFVGEFIAYCERQAAPVVGVVEVVHEIGVGR